MKITLIVAVSENGVIGNDNKLQWRLRDDMRNFKMITTGHFVIMGRKTFESIGKPLKDRTNIVITKNPDFSSPGVIMMNSVDKAVQYAEDHKQKEIFIIGGGEIYREFLKRATKMYYTRVKARVSGDVYFPEINWDEWAIISESLFVQNEQNDFDFEIMELKKKDRN